jgi:hypothetical protein
VRIAGAIWFSPRPVALPACIHARNKPLRTRPSNLCASSNAPRYNELRALEFCATSPLPSHRPSCRPSHRPSHRPSCRRRSPAPPAECHYCRRAAFRLRYSLGRRPGVRRFNHPTSSLGPSGWQAVFIQRSLLPGHASLTSEELPSGRYDPINYGTISYESRFKQTFI